MATHDAPAASRVPLGELALARGLLSADELRALLEREKNRTPRTGARRLTGEALVVERYATAAVVDELLEEQRTRRGGAASRRVPFRARPAGSTLDDYLAFVRTTGARELILVAGRPPAVRTATGLRAVDGPALSLDDVKAFVAKLLGEGNASALEKGGSVRDVAALPQGRFRVLASASEQGPFVCVRPLDLSLEQAGVVLPEEVASLADARQGLLLVAGRNPTVRTDAIARLVDRINGTSARHVITIEQPLTYEHRSKKSLVAQREVGLHVHGFAEALRAALREDPDVLVPGDLTDPDAAAMALLAAETGHLVIGSVHAAEAQPALLRLIEVQSTAKRGLVRASLADVLQAVVVVETVAGKANETFLVADVVRGSAMVRRLIREDRLHELQVQTNASLGIASRDDHLVRLSREGRISRMAALELANDATHFRTVENAR